MSFEHNSRWPKLPSLKRRSQIIRSSALIRHEGWRRAVTGAKLPLVVSSHGRGGWFGLHHDTAEALADAGFVVAAINHPGDNGNDSSQSETLSLGLASGGHDSPARFHAKSLER